jgi:acylphosphatase
MAAIRVHMFISGRVQGVFYRSSSRRKALELGLTGWVRNLPDGRVEIVVEGEEDQVEKLIDWCRKGPPSADVKGLEIKQEPPTHEFKRFSVKF